MPRNTELISRQYAGRHPLPAVPLADNALHLKGIPGELYVLREELEQETGELSQGLLELLQALEGHAENTDIHLSPEQATKIQDAIDAVQALNIANQAINDAKNAIIQEAVNDAKDYTDGQIEANKVEFDDTPTENSTNAVTSDGIYKALQNNETYTDPTTGEIVDQPLNEALIQNPQTRVNPEYFYRFKNMIENSSFEVFNGTTLLPLGWDAGEVSADASIFGTHSLKLENGVTAKMTSKFQPDYTWMYPNPYNATDCVLCFYHKYNKVRVQVYDVENEEYLTLTELSSELEEMTGTGTYIDFNSINNWSKDRCMVKFTPPANARKLRVEFTGKSGTHEGAYIDAPMLEPYVPGEYPSIYKDGRYSVSAYQILNPPPADVDRFTDVGHLHITESLSDAKGNIYYQELARADGSLAIKREASNPDTNGYYQTIVETFYKGDETINYVDTWSFTYTSSGAILTSSRSTTEV